MIEIFGIMIEGKLLETLQLFGSLLLGYIAVVLVVKLTKSSVNPLTAIQQLLAETFPVAQRSLASFVPEVESILDESGQEVAKSLDKVSATGKLDLYKLFKSAQKLHMLVNVCTYQNDIQLNYAGLEQKTNKVLVNLKAVLNLINKEDEKNLGQLVANVNQLLNEINVEVCELKQKEKTIKKFELN